MGREPGKGRLMETCIAAFAAGFFGMIAADLVIKAISFFARGRDSHGVTVIFPNAKWVVRHVNDMHSHAEHGNERETI